MKKLIIVLFAVVLFSSCSQDEPKPSNTMFGVSGERYETDDNYNFEVLNSTKSEYLKFKDDAESHFNMKMDEINTYPDWTNHWTYDGYNYYSISWFDNSNTFIFSWSK